MRKFNFFILLILTSCSSGLKKPRREPNFNQLQAIQWGSAASSVEKELGPPTQIIKKGNSETGDLWMYDNKEGHQIGTILVDSETQVVVGSLVILNPDQPESKLDFLINTKFSGTKFEKTQRRRCHRHYFPPEIFYISQEKGIIIMTLSLSKEVFSLSWTSPSYAEHFMKQLKSCER